MGAVYPLWESNHCARQSRRGKDHLCPTPVSYTHLGVHPDGKERKGYSKDYIHSFSAVMQQSFRFAVFPKQYITFNPMQYIKLRYQTDEVDLFSDEDMDGNIQPISRKLVDCLEKCLIYGHIRRFAD